MLRTRGGDIDQVRDGCGQRCAFGRNARVDTERVVCAGREPVWRDAQLGESHAPERGKESGKGNGSWRGIHPARFSTVTNAPWVQQHLYC